MIRSTHSIHINRPVHEVFEYLRDLDNRIFWQGNLTSHRHEKIDRGSRVTEVRNVLGRRVEIQGEITEFKEDYSFTFVGKGPAVERLEYHYRLTREAGGTRLDTEIDVEPNAMFSLAIPIVQRLTDRETDHAHKTLKDILEHEEAHEKIKELPVHAHHRTDGS